MQACVLYAVLGHCNLVTGTYVLLLAGYSSLGSPARYDLFVLNTIQTKSYLGHPCTHIFGVNTTQPTQLLPAVQEQYYK